MFSHIFHNLFKNCIIHQLKKTISNAIFNLFLDLPPYQYMVLTKRLNLMILCAFLDVGRWFNGCFRFIMCTNIDFTIPSSYNLFDFRFWFFQAKRVKYFEVYVKFQDIKRQLHINHCHHYSLLWDLHSIWKYIQVI